jgi:predicted nucleotidyltransferase
MAKKTSGKESLINAVCSKNGLRLLKIFLFKPDLEIYQSEFVKTYGISISSISGILKMFEEYSILRVSRKGDIKLYSLVEDNPVNKQLKILINVTDIYEIVKGLADKNTDIYLFGSAARGEDTINSDIDLLVVTDMDKSAIFPFIDSLAKNMGRDVNPVIYTPLQYAGLSTKDKTFYDSISKDLIRVI